ncbi:hypothetical protein JXB12_03690 [candidate division KSB1 bacterium]|nr:hypothetical protein [candidate division KSB1 bacterium]
MEDNTIGQEINAYCGKCKTDTIHLITSIENDKILKVMCKHCNAYHQYRAPKGTVIETKVKKVAPPPKKKTTRRRRTKAARLLENLDFDEAIEYKMDRNYETNMAIVHKIFGNGIVQSVIDRQKIEVLFQDGPRIMVQNYIP